MAEQRRDGAPAVENRWWVDTGKTDERTRPSAPAARAPVGSRFFDIGYAFDQEGARTRLSDINLKFLEEARPVPGQWTTLRMVPAESVPAAQIERIKRHLALPPDARGVIVDSGRSARFIITGDPVGERVLEFTLGEESSFDCWVRGDWVHEDLFRNVEDALRKAGPYVRHYLGSNIERW
ncbi:MAG: hypothetical protein E6J72_16355 [Deltaproteobacteria bacterium]|nr:MAG: hypothetical protein E6J72_16355 [Deltaproteobacteria bacterium]